MSALPIVEECCFYRIRQILSDPSQECIESAQKIFDDATNKGIWQQKDPEALLGTSFDTWAQSARDYKKEAQTLIDSAIETLRQRQQPSVESPPLVFRKVAVVPSPKSVKI